MYNYDNKNKMNLRPLTKEELEELRERVKRGALIENHYNSLREKSWDTPTPKRIYSKGLKVPRR